MDWRAKRSSILLAVGIIVLAMISTIYGIISTNNERNTIRCNRSIIVGTSQALIVRDQADIAQAQSADRADKVRRQIILLLANKVFNQGRSPSPEELDILLADYELAVNKRGIDLQNYISSTQRAPLPDTSCLDGSGP